MTVDFKTGGQTEATRQSFPLVLAAGPALRDASAEAILHDPDRQFPAHVSIDEYFPAIDSIAIFNEDGTKSS